MQVIKVTVKPRLEQEEQETIEVCDYCFGPIHQSRVDGLDTCQECGCVEGYTHKISTQEFDKLHGYDASYDDSIAGYSLTSGDPIYR